MKKSLFFYSYYLLFSIQGFAGSNEQKAMDKCKLLTTISNEMLCRQKGLPQWLLCSSKIPKLTDQTGAHVQKRF